VLSALQHSCQQKLLSSAHGFLDPDTHHYHHHYHHHHRSCQEEQCTWLTFGPAVSTHPRWCRCWCRSIHVMGEMPRRVVITTSVPTSYYLCQCQCQCQYQDQVQDQVHDKSATAVLGLACVRRSPTHCIACFLELLACAGNTLDTHQYRIT
jgi:hypothetical protein